MKIILTISLLLILNSTLGCKSPANLHDAAMKGDTTAIKQCLDRGVSVNSRRGDGRTALHIAAEIADTNLAAFLIQKGAAINETDSADLTPLHLAMGKFAPTLDELANEFDRNRPAITKFLLSHGANANAVDKFGWTPLHWAAYWNQTNSIRFLCERGVDPNIETSRQKTLESVIGRSDDQSSSPYSFENITFPRGSTPLDIVATGSKNTKEMQRYFGRCGAFMLLKQFGATQKLTHRGFCEIDSNVVKSSTSTVPIITGDSTNGMLITGRIRSPDSIGHSFSDSLKSEIQAVIDANAASIHSCYSREFKKTHDLKGFLTLKITINQAGKVSGLSSSVNTIGDVVAICAQKKIRNWNFPKSAQIITITLIYGFDKFLKFEPAYEL